MDLAQAMEIANALTLPGFLSDEESLQAERRQNEEAIRILSNEWQAAPKGKEPFPFDVVRRLADRNRATCDSIGADKLRDLNGTSLARSLSEDDLVRAVAKMQHRKMTQVRSSAGMGLRDLGVAYVEAPVSGIVVGIDIETTDRYPDRGYIVNLGFEFMRLTPDAVPQEGHEAYFGIPEIPYKEAGVPLEFVHHITWDMLEGKPQFRDAKDMQKAILTVLKAYPYMAHNAAFEDSWLMLHLDGYAEARKAGKIIPIDTRDSCRRIDVDGRTLPREMAPNALENWARRRKTLLPQQKERHLGLDDVDLMLRTVQAEFRERNMF